MIGGDRFRIESQKCARNQNYVGAPRVSRRRSRAVQDCAESQQTLVSNLFASCFELKIALLESMPPKRKAEVEVIAAPDHVSDSDSDSDSSVATDNSTTTKQSKNPKADPSKLRPASELSAFLICRWYDKTKTFASTIKHAQKQGYNLYNAAIERAIKSERERKAKEFEESMLSKHERDLKRQQEQQILNDATDLRGRKPVLDKESMELLHKAAGRERDRLALIRPTRTDCEYLIDIMHWKQCKRDSCKTTKCFMQENSNIHL